MQLLKLFIEDESDDPLTTDHGPRTTDQFRYAELTCKTNFSLHEGASHAEELAEEAKRLGLYALAATDTESLSGIVRAHTVAKEAGVKFIVGVEVRPLDAPAVVLW